MHFIFCGMKTYKNQLKPNQIEDRLQFEFSTLENYINVM